MQWKSLRKKKKQILLHVTWVDLKAGCAHVSVLKLSWNTLVLLCPQSFPSRAQEALCPAFPSSLQGIPLESVCGVQPHSRAYSISLIFTQQPSLWGTGLDPPSNLGHRWQSSLGTVFPFLCFFSTSQILPLLSL